MRSLDWNEAEGFDQELKPNAKGDGIWQKKSLSN